MATQTETLIYEIKVDDGGASAKFDAWDAKLAKSEKATISWQKVSLDAFGAVVNSISQLSVDAVKNFAQFENTLSHARRTMGLTKDETLALGDSLIALSTSFEDGGLKAAVSSNELAKIAGVLGQLGFSAKEDADAFNNLVATVAKIGIAFGMSNEKAAEGLGILQNLYNLPTEQLSNIASSIAYLGNTTVATAGQILDMMQRVGGIAGILGVTATEMAGIAATLRESGVSAQVGGTAMSQIFSRLSSDVEKFGEVLGAGGLNAEMLRFKIESGNATDALKDVLQAIQTINATEGKIAAIQALNDLGLQGVRVQQTLLALSNNIGGLNENLAKSQQAFDENVAINEAYEGAIDNTAVKMQEFWNIVDAIQKIIGKDLALAFSDFLDNYLLPFTDHFKTWIETSKGADAIFGQNGMIATGLQILGEQLAASEDDIFKWLDTLDADAGEIFQGVIDWFKKLAGENLATWERVREDIGVAVDAFHNFLQTIEDVNRWFEDLWNTVKFFFEGLADFGEKIQLDHIFQPITDFFVNFDKISAGWDKVKQILSDVGTSSQGLTQDTRQYAYALQAANEAGAELGKEMVYNSVLPDIEKATISLNKKTLQYGDGIKTVTTHTKFLYKTGENAWSNINREIEAGTNAWFLADNYIKKGQEDVQFSLYQTADAVASLGNMYGQTAQEAGKAAAAIQQVFDTADIWKDKIALPTGASDFVNAATAGNAASMTAIAGAGGLDAATLSALSRQPGFMSAGGLLDAQKQMNANAQSAGGIFRPTGTFQPTAGTTLPTTEAARQQALNVTLMMDNQEVGRMTTIIADRQQQNNRRSTGARATR